MSFDRVKPFAEAITGAHMVPRQAGLGRLRSYRGVNTRFFTGGRRFGEAEPASAKRPEQTLP
jgi:hypothetical protein